MWQFSEFRSLWYNYSFIAFCDRGLRRFAQHCGMRRAAARGHLRYFLVFSRSRSTPLALHTNTIWSRLDQAQWRGVAIGLQTRIVFGEDGGVMTTGHCSHRRQLLTANPCSGISRVPNYCVSAFRVISYILVSIIANVSSLGNNLSLHFFSLGFGHFSNYFVLRFGFSISS